jgi:hypothetical protein
MKPLVFGQIHDAHAPGTDALEDPVVRDDSTQEGIHRVFRSELYRMIPTPTQWADGL